jgi:hypothetical protein
MASLLERGDYVYDRTKWCPDPQRVLDPDGKYIKREIEAKILRMHVRVIELWESQRLIKDDSFL